MARGKPKGGRGKGKATTAKDAPMATRSKTGKKQPEGKACLDDLGKSLAQLGLRIRQVTADGNCFFRACSDQLCGGEQHHMSLRHDVVAFMQDHEPDFAPYMEDDENFNSYTKRMKKDGVWAGQQEQVALTRLKGVKICVYQQGQPCWTIAPDYPEIRKDAATLHLSYHDSEHYNSVRSADDMGGEPATPIMLASSTAQVKKDTCQWERPQEQPVVAPQDNSSAAKEEATQDQQAENEGSEEIELPHHRREPQSELSDPGHEKCKHVDQTGEANGAGCQGSVPRSEVVDDAEVKRGLETTSSPVPSQKQTVKKAPTRNGACPCGSRRRYKDCCLPVKKAAARRAEQEQQEYSDYSQAQVVNMATIFV